MEVVWILLNSCSVHSVPASIAAFNAVLALVLFGGPLGVLLPLLGGNAALWKTLSGLLVPAPDNISSVLEVRQHVKIGIPPRAGVPHSIPLGRQKGAIWSPTLGFLSTRLVSETLFVGAGPPNTCTALPVAVCRRGHPEASVRSIRPVDGRERPAPHVGERWPG